VFQNPQAFWYLLICLPVFYILFLRYKSGVRDLKRLGGLWREVYLTNIFLVKWFFSSLLFLLFILLVIFSLASPVWGSYPEAYNPDGLDITFLVDLSRSMSAEDVPPNRLSRTKSIIQGLAEGLKANRFSVVGFKGVGVVVMPATQDRETLYTLVERVSTDSITAGSTNLEEGLKAALRSLPDNTNSRGVVILFSDGESLSGDPLKAAALAVEMGIPIYAVGAGTVEGGYIPLPGGDVLRDPGGKPVLTRMNKPVLENLAISTGGKFFLLGDPVVLTKMIAGISEDYQDLKRKGFKIEGRDQYRGFLMSALVVLFILVILRIVPWKDAL